jgi:glutaredoxin-related protein
MVIYGSMLCPDCVQCCKDLDAAGIAYTFCDFADDLSHLKAFLKIRESDPQFEELKREGKIGIPCIVRDDGVVSLAWK